MEGERLEDFEVIKAFDYPLYEVQQDIPLEDEQEDEEMLTYNLSREEMRHQGFLDNEDGTAHPDVVETIDEVVNLLDDYSMHPIDRIKHFRYWQLNQLMPGEPLPPVLAAFQQQNQEWISRRNANFGSMPGRNMLSGRQGRFGFHKFTQCKFEDLGMGKLKMRDSNCVFESLMLIEYYNQYNSLPHCNNRSWQTYVLNKFNNLMIHDQNLISDGCLQDILYWFNSNHSFRVGFFNCHQYEEAYEDIKVQEHIHQKNYKGVVPRYYLCYYQHHTFPIQTDKIPKLVEEIRKKFMRTLNITPNQADRVFGYVPHVFKLLDVDLNLCALNNKSYEETLACRMGFDTIHVLCYSSLAGSQLPVWEQVDMCWKNYIENKDNIPNLMYQGEFINNLNSKSTEDRQSITAAVLRSQEMLKMKFIASDPQQANAVRVKSEKRMKEFDEIGLAAIDIETCYDSSGQHSEYNMRPFLLHVYGKLWCTSIKKKEQTAADSEQTTVQKQLREVDTYFKGFDCMEQFMRYLKLNNYIWTDSVHTELSMPQQSERKIANYLWAHNGFGFDWLYFFEPLMKELEGFKVIGDSSKTKCFKGNGLHLYDFKYIYAERLSQLAKQFFPGDASLQKLDCDDIIDMPPEVAQTLITEGVYTYEDGREVLMDNIIEYCRRDTIVLFRIVQTFFKNLYCHPKGMSFVEQPFYHSASAIAWEVLTNCFLKVPLIINPSTQPIEQKMKLGGLTQEYRSYCQFGVIIDVNSEYPSVMKNLMPVTYKHMNDKALQQWPGDRIITSQNIKNNKIEKYNIYVVHFKFSDNCMFPTICVRTEKTLIQPRESEHFHSLDPIAGHPIYGDTIITALECDPGCQIRIDQYIEFVPDYIFKDYVEHFYSERLKSQAAGNKIDDKFNKMMLNTAFGKFIQKQYKHSTIGTEDEINDFLSLLLTSKEASQVRLERMLTENVPIYQLKYKLKHDDLQHRGTMVRIGSLIMEYARNHLMRMKHTIAREFGPESICYSDTDSVVVSFDKCKLFDGEGIMLSTMVSSIHDLYKYKKENGLDYSRQVAEMKQIFENSQCINRLKELRIQDLTNLQDPNKVIMLDESKLGAAKIEKYVINGHFLAPKQYMLNYFADGKISQMIKVKGVQQRFMNERIFLKIQDSRLSSDQIFKLDDSNDMVLNDPEDLNQSIFSNSDWREEDMCDVSAAHVQVEKWNRFYTGIVKAPIIKILTANHKKRLFDQQGFSTPFQNVKVQSLYDQEVTLRNERNKNQLKGILEDEYNKIKNDCAYRLASQATVKKGYLIRESMQGYLHMKSVADEAKKRFMIQLPKLRYQGIQDQVIQILFKEPECVALVKFYLPKIISISHKAAMVKKSQKKKANSEFQLNPLESGKVIGFCLMTHFILISKQIEIPENFQIICKILSQVVRGLVDTTFKVVKDKWRFATDWGLHFLSCPIAIVDYDSSNQEDPLLFADYIKLDRNVSTVTLWFIFNQFLDQLALVEEEYEEEEKEEEMPKQFFDLTTELRVDVDDDDAINKIVVQQKDINKRSPFLIDQGIDYAKLTTQEEQETQDRIFYNKFLKTMSKAYMLSPSYIRSDVQDKANALCSLIFTEESQLKEHTLYQLFTKNKDIDKTQLKNVSKEFVVDIVITAQFFYFGLQQARLIVRSILKEQKRFFSKTHNIVQALRVVFQRQSMFQGAQNKKHIESKVKDLLTIIEQFVMDDKLDEYQDGPIAFRFQLTVLDEAKKISPALEEIIFDSVLTGANQGTAINHAAQIGKLMTQRLMKWLKPTQQMKNKLYSILLLEADVKFYDDLIQADVIQEFLQENIDLDFEEQQHEVLGAELNMEIDEAARHMPGYQFEPQGPPQVIDPYIRSILQNTDIEMADEYEVPAGERAEFNHSDSMSGIFKMD